MAAIQVSLLEALSPAPAKVASSRRSPISEVDQGTFGVPAPWEDSEPLKVHSPAAAQVPQLPGQADILPCALSGFGGLSASAAASRADAAGPRKVALPAEAVGSLSPVRGRGFDSAEGEDRFGMSLVPQLPSSPMPRPVQLSAMLAEDGGLEREAMARETVMRLGLASPCQPRSWSKGLLQPEAQKITASFLLDAETATGLSTPCSSPDRQSITGSPCCSDQETSRAWSKSAPSLGSARHVDGSCQPCAWFWKSVGCQSGAECSFCHLCPEGVLKARKKAKQAMKRMGLATPKAYGQQPKTALSLACLV